MSPGGDKPFYVGEKVIAVDAMSGSLIKNGQVYEVYSCDMRRCSDGCSYWYVGVTGHHNSLRPTIFAPIRGVLMNFKEIENTVYAN